MQQYIACLIVTLLSACGTPSHRADPVPYPPPIDEAAQPETKTPKSPQVKITTSGDLAAALGLHSNFLYLANNACAMRIDKCSEDMGKGIDIADCEVIIAVEWCKVNDCSNRFLMKKSWKDPCRLEVRARECDDLERPLECEGAKARGLVLKPGIWPEGEVLPPYDTWLRDL